MTPTLLVVGASARALADSAARAGFAPYFIDQFGDADLRRCHPGVVLDPDRFEAGLEGAFAAAPRVPWVYTGPLENHVGLLQRLATLRPLLGNGPEAVLAVREPNRLVAALAAHGCAQARVCSAAPLPSGGQWLCKPLRSTGGMGIESWNGVRAVDFDACYLQQRVPGPACSGLYLADGVRARLIAVCRQLIGEPQCNAAAFRYCGSIGPIEISAARRAQWQDIGSAIAAEFGLRGLFGVDAIDAEHAVVPVEVNPRYTASVEVIERALGVALLEAHRAACAGTLIDLPDTATRVVGKAYLYAPVSVTVLDYDVHAVDAGFADRPYPGSHIPAGAPIATVLSEATAVDPCRHALMVAASRRLAALTRPAS